MEPVELKRKKPADVRSVRTDPVDGDVLDDVRDILSDVEEEGETAVRKHAVRLGDISADEPLYREPDDLEDAYGTLPAVQRDVLESTARRIRDFAGAQMSSLEEVVVNVKGGEAGQEIRPVANAGAYVPGGEYPLASTAMMTAIPAREAGVDSVWISSPGPSPATLAAAHVAEADGVITAGGVQGIAALAFGVGPVPPSDVLVGPGNRWVTAAKFLLSGRIEIDFLAGPTELVVLAGPDATAERVAADLLAQAEHAPDALPVLVTPEENFIEDVEQALAEQLEDLPTEDVARRALEETGFAVHVQDREEGARVCDRIAPEHLHVTGFSDPEFVRDFCANYGALFLGSESAEVFGDYGVGPNHVLPTGGTARSTGGLSVMDFLRFPTWIELGNPGDDREFLRNVAVLARMEGLEAHARSAERRLSDTGDSS